MLKHKTYRILIILCASLFLGGCAVGQKIRYHDAELAINASGDTMIAVTCLDGRPYIKSGEKDKTYIGNFRGGFGNPFNVSTESQKPLADDITSVICASLQKKGFACTPISVEPNETQDQIINKLKVTKAKRLILLAINEWRSDTYSNTSLYYDIVLTIMDNQGARLAESDAKGEDDLGGSFGNPPAHAKEAVPKAYKKKLESLLNGPSVIDALK
jgi:hypothetical protein